MTKNHDGAELIAAERRRQVEAEGYTPEHDDEHYNALALRAAELAVAGTGARVTGLAMTDAWGLVTKHRGDRVRQLVIAGALIAAEIDRLQRQAKAALAAPPAPPPSGDAPAAIRSARTEAR